MSQKYNTKVKSGGFIHPVKINGQSLKNEVQKMFLGNKRKQLIHN